MRFVRLNPQCRRQVFQSQIFTFNIQPPGGDKGLKSDFLILQALCKLQHLMSARSNSIFIFYKRKKKKIDLNELSAAYLLTCDIQINGQDSNNLPHMQKSGNQTLLQNILTLKEHYYYDLNKG